jgi:HK97 family phage prohead protease
VAELRDHIWRLPEKAFHTPAAPQRKFTDQSLAELRWKLLADGTVKSDVRPGDTTQWVFRISSEAVDLYNDVIKIDGWRFDAFVKNAPVLFSHNANAPPIAQSSPPFRVGTSLLAVANFPAVGVSGPSDEVGGMVRAGLVRGASVGFAPIRFVMSDDPTRPFGINFLEVRLLEWSVCSIPANSECVALGPAGNKSARTTARTSPPTTSRAQRLAEAGEMRRIAYGRG